MKPGWALALGLVWALAGHRLDAGEQVTAEVEDVRSVAPEVLQDAPLKGVLTEFIDPGNTGLGASLGYLLWREASTAVRDPTGARIAVGGASGAERRVDSLARDYHQAALRIAASHRARFALWGAVEIEGERLYVDTYLSILTAGGASDLNLGLTAGRVGRRPGASRPRLEARLARTKFGFATAEIDRDELFARPLIVERAARLREHPAVDAPVVAQVAAGSVLESVDMEAGWFVVPLEGGGYAYLAAGRQDDSAGSPAALQVPPRTVEADGAGVELRQGPGSDYPLLASRRLQGRFQVLDMFYREGHGTWYQISLDGQAGWVAESLVRPRFSFPAVHMLAGLYWYYAGSYGDAAEEFRQFLSSPGAAQSAANRSAASQLLGVSELLTGRDAAAWKALSQAVELTPYDPDAYMVRSVAGVGLGRDAELDIERALALDSRNRRAHSLAESLLQIDEQRSPQAGDPLHRDEAQPAPKSREQDEESGGPRIVILEPEMGPDEVLEVAEIADILVAFEPVQAPVDMRSLKITMRRGAFSKDMTSRVQPYVEGTVLRLSRRQMPEGKFRMRFEISDVEGRTSERTVRLRVKSTAP